MTIPKPQGAPLEAIDPAISTLQTLIRRERDEQAARFPIQTRRFVIATLAIDVAFSNAALADLVLEPFAPMQSFAASGTPDLVWNIFEARQDHISRASVPQAPQAPGIHGNIFSDTDNRLIAERRMYSDTVFDSAQGVLDTIYWSTENLTLYERAKPLLRFFYLLLYQRGILVTHAALVGRETRGIMITGRGGVGKTTTSVASLTGGLDFVSDDYVALERRGDRYIGHILFSSLMLNEQHIQRFPIFAQSAIYPALEEETKALVYPHRLFPTRIKMVLPVDAVAVPSFVNGEERTMLLPGGRGETLRALGPSSVYSSPWREKTRFDFYADLLARLPCFTLKLGSAFQELAAPLAEYCDNKRFSN